MGVVSWLALLAIVAYRTPAVSGGLANADAVTLRLVSGTKDGDLFEKVVLTAATKAAVYTGPVTHDSKCLDPALQKAKGNFVLITDRADCPKPTNGGQLLSLVLDANNQFTASSGSKQPFAKNDTKTLGSVLDSFVNTIVVANKPVQQSGSVYVPVFAIVAVGVAVGVLLALTCIFYNKYRVATKKVHPADDKKSSKSSSAAKTSKGSSSQRSTSKKERKKKGSSSRSGKSASSSQSSKRSSKGKKGAPIKESCRSSKSLATKTCDISGPSSVQVIATAPPLKPNNAAPAYPMISKDEVASVMASRCGNLPERSLDRVRAPATVPPRCCTTQPTVSRPPVIVSQPRPISTGPSIIPTVSVIGHAPSPFAVLAKATTPLPPASTPALLASDQTAYCTRSLTTVTAVEPTPSTTVPPPTVSQAPATVPSPTVSSKPSNTTVAPMPLTLVPTVSLSSVVPVAVTPAAPGSAPGTAPSPTSGPAAYPTHMIPVPTPSIPVSRIPISPEFSLASTPRSTSPNTTAREKPPSSSPDGSREKTTPSPSSSREKAPTSKRSQRK